MSAMSRFGPSVARSILVQHHRNMASAASATDPVQKIFLDKIREFRVSNKGLDETHQKALHDEMLRLKRVFSVEDEAKLAHFDHKFSSEHDITLRDIDENKEKRAKIASGEYQRHLTAETKKESFLLASIPDQTPQDMHLPPLNKPDYALMHEHAGVPKPMVISDRVAPDWEFVGDKMTPERLERELNVKFGDKMPTIHDDAKPGRDAVNFPRFTPLENPPPTRYHVFPESWFQFLYPKTGVTGPYAFFGGFSTFLLSKEWVPFEHEFLTVISTAVVFSYAVIKFGPMTSKFVTDMTSKIDNDWDHWQQGHIQTLKSMKDHYKDQLNKGNVLEDLYEARRADVEVQLECEHRNRVKTIYDDTKRRLNYLVAKADSQRQIHHANMINWVISNVLSSIGGQKQENDILDNCVLNLRQLATKNAKSI